LSRALAGKMKNVRERMKATLSISIEKNGVSKMVPRTMHDRTRKIREMSEADVKARYTIQTELMESCHAGMQVLLATRSRDGMEVVVKTRERSKSFRSAADERDWRATTEVQMNMPPTSTLCRLIEVIQTKNYYYVVMEKVEGQDLHEQMSEKDLKISDAREVLYQILEALKFLHEQGRIHKDLKLENVMVDMNAVKEPSSPGGRKTPPEPRSPGVKLIDFDTVEDWEPTTPKAEDVMGSDGYIAPEAYLGIYSPASDIYCAGVIMYKLLTQAYPFPFALFDDRPGENWVGSPAMKRIYERLRNQRIDFKWKVFQQCPEAADLCTSMLKFNALERPSAEEALNHAWFQLNPDVLSPSRSRATVDREAAPIKLPTSSGRLPTHS